MSDDLTCPKCGKHLSWLSGSPAHINNLYCEHCGYRAWDREAQPLANNSISRDYHDKKMFECFDTFDELERKHKAQLVELKSDLLMNIKGTDERQTIRDIFKDLL